MRPDVAAAGRGAVAALALEWPLGRRGPLPAACCRTPPTRSRCGAPLCELIANAPAATPNQLVARLATTPSVQCARRRSLVLRAIARARPSGGPAARGSSPRPRAPTRCCPCSTWRSRSATTRASSPCTSGRWRIRRPACPGRSGPRPRDARRDERGRRPLRVDPDPSVRYRGSSHPRWLVDARPGRDRRGAGPRRGRRAGRWRRGQRKALRILGVRPVAAGPRPSAPGSTQ